MIAKKKCQSISIGDDSFICGEVLRRTKHRHGVAIGVCSNCNEEFIKHMCEVVSAYHKGKKNPLLPFDALTKAQMVENFKGAMGRAAKKRFKRVPKRVYIERKMACTFCGKGTKCPYCGCFRKAKAWLASEEACPTPETYPNLPKYPLRNFWGVINEKVSVIIPSRNDPHLYDTVKDILEQAIGSVEVIVILDGPHSYEMPKGKRIKTILLDPPAGRRIGINKAAQEATGEYLFILDAHCGMSLGWDTKLKCGCGERDIIFSSIVPMDPDTGEEHKVGGAKKYRTVVLDFDLREVGSSRLIKSKPQESMAFTGCSWMIRKDYFWLLNGYDESLGEYGYDGAEWSLKVWLNERYPGKVLYYDDVVCKHIFLTNLQGTRYSPQVIHRKDFRKRMFDLYGNKIYELVEKFWPVATWPSSSEKYFYEEMAYPSIEYYSQISTEGDYYASERPHSVTERSLH